jgi:hypothetical protein
MFTSDTQLSFLHAGHSDSSISIEGKPQYAASPVQLWPSCVRRRHFLGLTAHVEQRSHRIFIGPFGSSNHESIAIGLLNANPNIFL